MMISSFITSAVALATITAIILILNSLADTPARSTALTRKTRRAKSVEDIPESEPLTSRQQRRVREGIRQAKEGKIAKKKI